MYMYVYIYICMYICKYIYMYIYIHISPTKSIGYPQIDEIRPAVFLRPMDSAWSVAKPSALHA